MLISDVVSVIQDLDRKRQVEILDQLYDSLDTKVKRDELKVFELSDEDLISFADRVQFGCDDSSYVKRMKAKRDLKKVTHLLILFSALQSEYDLHKYSLRLPLQQVIDNYRFHKTAWTSDALAYVLSANKTNIVQTLRDLEDSKLVLSLIQLAVENDDLETTEQVLEYFDELDDDRDKNIRYKITVDFFYALKTNEVSKRFLAWYQGNRTSEDVGMDIVQSLVVEADRSIPLLKMIGERIEDYVTFLSWEHPEPFPDFVKNLLRYEGVDIEEILSLLEDEDARDGIKVVKEIANNQV